MQVKQAVVKRIKSICETHNMAYNELAVKAGITLSTLYSMLDSSRKDVGIVAIKKICDGLDISLNDFFDDRVFRNLEQEIK